MQRTFFRGYRWLSLGFLATVLALGVEQCFAPAEAHDYGQQQQQQVKPVAMQLQQSSEGPKTLTVWIPYEGYYAEGSLRSSDGVRQVQVWDYTTNVWITLPYEQSVGGGFLFMATGVRGARFSAPKIGTLHVSAHPSSLTCEGNGTLIQREREESCDYSSWAR